MGFQTMADQQHKPFARLTIDRMIHNEVRFNLTSLVQTLASANGLIEQQTRNYSGAKRDNDAEKEVMSLCEQAAELCAPVDDWEEAVWQEGFQVRHDMHGFYVCSDLAAEHEDRGNPSAGFDGRPHYATKEEAYHYGCEELQIEPYQWEVFEHWAVSQWLGDKLKAHGEKVDDDFAGHVVWARTNAGQGMACDGVMQTIFAEMTAPSES